jgi:hypothetical protein
MGNMPNPALVETATAGFFYATDSEREQIWAMARRNSLDFGRSQLGDQIATAMRGRIPVEGWEWEKLLTVLLEPAGRRQHIAAHFHKRHLMMWYPQAASIWIDKDERKCEAGEMLYVPPGTLHSVPRVTIERLSVAMLVDV